MITETNNEQPERTLVEAATSLYDIMAELSGVSFISLDTTTEQKVNKFYVDDDGEKKPNPHHGRITKKMIGGRGLIYQNKNVNGFQNQVNSQMKKEGLSGEFKVGPRSWGVREKDLPIVTLRDQVYLEVIFADKGKTQYYLDDHPIDRKDILGLPKQSKPTGQGGVKQQIVIRTFKVESIDALRVFRKEYTNVTK